MEPAATARVQNDAHSQEWEITDAPTFDQAAPSPAEAGQAKANHHAKGMRTADGVVFLPRQLQGQNKDRNFENADTNLECVSAGRQPHQRTSSNRMVGSPV